MPETMYSHYMTLLQHPNLRQRTDALQDIFFYLLNGHYLHPNQWEKLIPLLVWNISTANDETLHRWAYQVGSFSLNNNSLLIDCCTSNLERETNQENRTWIVAILSKNLPKAEFIKMVNGKDHGLTDDNIQLATYLFAESPPTINVNSILNQSDPLSLMWIASIGAYKNIAHHNKRKELVTSKTLIRLADETDNDEVLKHIMYAFYLQRTFSIRDLPFSPDRYKQMGDQQKKWFFTLVWKDRSFLTDNIDYFRELLSERHLFQEINSEVRIGIARGMANSLFQSDLTPNILEWYSHENSPSVTYYLLKHFQANQLYSEQYRSIVEYQSQYGSNALQGLITSSRLQQSTLSCNVKGEENMKIDIHAEHIGTIYNAGGNQIILNAFDSFSDNLVEELQQLRSVCDDELKTDVDAAIDAIRKKDESKFKVVLKKIGKAGFGFLSNIAASTLVVYMQANGLLP